MEDPAIVLPQAHVQLIPNSRTRNEGVVVASVRDARAVVETVPGSVGSAEGMEEPAVVFPQAYVQLVPDSRTRGIQHLCYSSKAQLRECEDKQEESLNFSTW